MTQMINKDYGQWTSREIAQHTARPPEVTVRSADLDTLARLVFSLKDALDRGFDLDNVDHGNIREAHAIAQQMKREAAQ